MTDRIVVAFSGGLDTSWLVAWLKETRKAEVVTVTVDVGGFTPAERESLAERSAALGASRHFLVDARERFFEEVLRFLLMGNVLRGEVYPICVGAERALQAREVARVARDLSARSIAHGSTAAGNDQVRFEVALRVLAPEMEILAPIRDQGIARATEIAFLEQRSLPVPARGGAYSVNAGLWGTTIGGKETTDTTSSIPEEAWVRTRGAFDQPRAPERHTIRFQRGIPCALDGAELAPVALIEKLDLLAAQFGIGRGIHLGDTILGIKGRVAFEAPAALVLIGAHRELEKLTLTAAEQRVKEHVARSYGEMVHEGQFLDPACRDIEALLLRSQERVTGEVHLLFRAGHYLVEGARAPQSLHAASRAVYGEKMGEWTAADAAGFARIRAIPAGLHARAGEKKN